MRIKKEKPLHFGPSASEKRRLRALEFERRAERVKVRGPKRSFIRRLSALPGWKPVFYVPKPRDRYEASDLDVDPSRPLEDWIHGWHLLKKGEAIPDAIVYTPKQRKPGVVPQGRLWVGTCKACDKHTVARSIFFTGGGMCLHCQPKTKTLGTNLFLAGNNPTGPHLFVFTARNGDHAEELRQERNHAWVVPLTAGKRNRAINLPETSTAAPERPNPRCWAFPLHDVPKSFYSNPVGETWLDGHGDPHAWFREREITLPEEAPEPDEEDYTAPEPELNTAGLVDFDNFM